MQFSNLLFWPAYALLPKGKGKRLVGKVGYNFSFGTPNTQLTTSPPKPWRLEPTDYCHPRRLPQPRHYCPLLIVSIADGGGDKTCVMSDEELERSEEDEFLEQRKRGFKSADFKSCIVGVGFVLVLERP